MCNKAVNNYPHALEFGPECYKTQEMCDKAVNRAVKFLYLGNNFCNKAVNFCFLFLFC